MEGVGRRVEEVGERMKGVGVPVKSNSCLISTFLISALVLTSISLYLFYLTCLSYCKLTFISHCINQRSCNSQWNILF